LMPLRLGQSDGKGGIRTTRKGTGTDKERGKGLKDGCEDEIAGRKAELIGDSE